MQMSKQNAKSKIIIMVKIRGIIKKDFQKAVIKKNCKATVTLILKVLQPLDT